LGPLLAAMRCGAQEVSQRRPLPAQARRREDWEGEVEWPLSAVPSQARGFLAAVFAGAGERAEGRGATCGPQVLGEGR
jgi:hypothetical protein